MGQGGSHSLRNFDRLRACDLQKGRAQRWVVCILQTALLAVAAAVAAVAACVPTYLPTVACVPVRQPLTAPLLGLTAVSV